MRRVSIEGNEKSRDNVVRREVKLADGDLFSGSKLRRSNERLDKLEYFEKVDIETVPTDNPSEVDIKVKVKDKNTGSISLGAGYSTSDSVFFGGSVEEKNLFGKGYHAKFQGMRELIRVWTASKCRALPRAMPATVVRVPTWSRWLASKRIGATQASTSMPTQRPAATRGESSRDCRGASLRQR